MGRYGINWASSGKDLTEKDYEIIFNATSKIISEKTADVKEISIAYYNRGFIYQKKGDYHKAVEDYTSAIALSYRHLHDAYFNRGLAYYKIKQFKLALSDFNDTLYINPDNEDAKAMVKLLANENNHGGS